MGDFSQITSTQAAKETVVNNHFKSVRPANIFGERPGNHSGLNYAYYGGVISVNGVSTSIADGSVALSNNATNYVEVTPAGTVTANTTGFTAGNIPLAVVTTSGGAITGVSERRHFLGHLFVGRVSKTVTTANVTPTADECQAQFIDTTGTLTGNRQLILPLVRKVWWIYNGCSGPYTLTVIGASGTGVVIPQGHRMAVICDGTNFYNAETGGLHTRSIAYAASIDPDAQGGDARFIVGQLTGNITINAPINLVAGARLTFMFQQDSTGGRVITWNAVFKKAADGAGTADQFGVTEFFCPDGTNLVQVGGALAWM